MMIRIQHKASFFGFSFISCVYLVHAALVTTPGNLVCIDFSWNNAIKKDLQMEAF